MNTSFEREVTVEKHANYGAFRASDKKFYKPVGDGLSLNNFPENLVVNVKGYSSESGKTNYITDIIAKGESPKRRLPAPPTESKSVAGDDKGFVQPKRDFIKEAKGKTFSLMVAGLAHTSLSAEEILSKADVLLKGIEDRGYF
jgi:hypothetical protein